MAVLGILILAGILVPGIVLVVGGVVGVRRSCDVMIRLLSWLAIVVGAAMEIVLGIALVMHRAPWNLMGVVAVVGLCVALFIFWVMVLADCLMNETREGNERLVWTLVIVFTSVIGAGLYYFLRRPKRVAEVSH